MNKKLNLLLVVCFLSFFCSSCFLEIGSELDNQYIGRWGVTTDIPSDNKVNTLSIFVQISKADYKVTVTLKDTSASASTFGLDNIQLIQNYTLSAISSNVANIKLKDVIFVTGIGTTVYEAKSPELEEFIEKNKVLFNLYNKETITPNQTYKYKFTVNNDKLYFNIDINGDNDFDDTGESSFLVLDKLSV